MLAIILDVAVQSEARRQVEGFAHLDSTFAVAANQGSGLEKEGEQVVDAGHCKIFITDVAEFSTGKESEEAVVITLSGEEDLPIGPFDLLPAGLPGRSQVVAGIGARQKAGTHVAEKVCFVPEVPGIMVKPGAKKRELG